MERFAALIFSGRCFEIFGERTRHCNKSGSGPEAVGTCLSGKDDLHNGPRKKVVLSSKRCRFAPKRDALISRMKIAKDQAGQVLKSKQYIQHDGYLRL